MFGGCTGVPSVVAFLGWDESIFAAEGGGAVVMVFGEAAWGGGEEGFTIEALTTNSRLGGRVGRTLPRSRNLVFLLLVMQTDTFTTARSMRRTYKLRLSRNVFDIPWRYFDVGDVDAVF